MESITDAESNLRMMGTLDKYANWQLEHVLPYLQGNVLEIGAGIGTITTRILSDKKVTSCSVTEINPKNLDILKNTLDGKASVYDVNIENEVPPAFIASFDTIISMNVMEHIKNDERFFANCCKCLRPGGRIIKFVPAMKSIFGTVDIADLHYRRYGPGDLRALASKNNLRVIKLVYTNLPGMFGWFYHGKILKAKVHPSGDLKLFNLLVPLFKKFESVISPPFGLSLVFVAES